MKLSDGYYFNMFQEIGHARYINADLDIIFLFHETMTREECIESLDEIEKRTRNALKKYQEYYEKSKLQKHYSDVIKRFIEDELGFNLELQIIVIIG